MFFYPEFLPDGKNILFGWAGEADGDVGIYLAAIERGKITRAPVLLRRNMTVGTYSPSGGGRLLYAQHDKLYAQKLNVRGGTLEGTAEQVLDGVSSDPSLHRADFSVSRNGVLVWRAGRAGVAQATWFDRTGKVLGTAGPPCLGDTMLLSPDQTHILLRSFTDHVGYSIAEADRSGFVGLTGVDDDPHWMPDNSHILYSRRVGDSYRLLERAVEGGPENELARLSELGALLDVSPDGRWALYHVAEALYSIRLDDPGAQPRKLANTPQAKFSPDGRWIVYPMDTGNKNEVQIFVQPFPTGLPTQISLIRGDKPVWRGDGQEILYLNGSTIYSVRVQVNDRRLRASPPEALFNIRRPEGLVGDAMPLAVTRDGSRILFAQGVEQPDPQLTYVMTNWDATLRH